MRAVARIYNLKFKAKEGFILSEEDMKRNRTFFVTSMRDPMERVVSSYFFEGLWPDDTPEHNRTMESARSLEDYIDFVTARPLRWKVWLCVSDCFTKWYGTSKVVGNMIRGYDLDTAKERLKRHHMIVRTESMKQPDYWERIMYLLGAENINLTQQGGIYNPGVYNPKNYTHLVSADAMKRLEDINRNDYELMDCLLEK